MEIRILIQTTDPLSGTATSDSQVPLDFHGWLELLKVLSVLAEAQNHPAEGEDGTPRGSRDMAARGG